MAKYAVIFGKDSWEDGSPVLLYGHVECTTDSLEKAGSARKVLGDLVFDMSTREVVQDPSWLFDVERNQELFEQRFPESPGAPYAVQAIKTRVRLAADFWDTGTKKVF